MLSENVIWNERGVSCVIVYRAADNSIVLKVRSNGQPFFIEQCTDPDDAAQRAEHLHTIFVDA